MKKYKVTFSGFAYVEAHDKEEAIINFELGSAFYEEIEKDEAVEIDECVVDF